MKLVILACVLAVALAEPPRSRAEPPRFKPARFRFQRLELAPTTTDSPTEATTDNAPYPASGWKPAGQPFTLPNEKTPDNTYGAPDNTYGAPDNTYGAPQQNAPYPPAGWKPDQPLTLPNEPPATSYGVPDNTYGAPDAETTTAATDNAQAEKLDGPVEVQKSMGEYYVLLPDGRLQRVEFMTENDIQNMKYTARLQLRNPAPLIVLRA